MKIQLDIEDSNMVQIEELKRQTGLQTYKDLFNNALELLSWAVRERLAQRSIASVDEQRHEYKELQMPVLEYAADAAKAKRGAA